jgi:ribosomal protein L37E
MVVELFTWLWRRGTSRLSKNASTVVCECRRCGASLNNEAERCPYCGPTSVVRYEIQ